MFNSIFTRLLCSVVVFVGILFIATPEAVSASEDATSNPHHSLGQGATAQILINNQEQQRSPLYSRDQIVVSWLSTGADTCTLSFNFLNYPGVTFWGVSGSYQMQPTGSDVGQIKLRCRVGSDVVATDSIFLEIHPFVDVKVNGDAESYIAELGEPVTISYEVDSFHVLRGDCYPLEAWEQILPSPLTDEDGSIQITTDAVGTFRYTILCIGMNLLVNAQEVVLTVVASNDNDLMTNGDFSDGLSHWGNFSGNLGWIENDQLHLRDGVMEQVIPATAGQTYTLSGQYQTVGNTTQRNAGIVFLDENQNKIGESAKAGLGIASQMNDFHGSATAPHGTQYVQVWLYSGMGGKTIFDDVKLMTGNDVPDGDKSCELLKNGEFDDGRRHWDTHWGQSGWIHQDSLNLRNGTMAQIVSGKAGILYELNGDYRTSGSTSNRNAGIVFFDANMNRIGESNKAGLSSNSSVTLFDDEAIAPNGTKFVQVWIYSGGSGVTIFDNLSLKDSSCGG